MRKFFTTSWLMMGCFALLNVFMYFSIRKFWIGGSSFLPMIGVLGKNNAFLFAFVVNIGVIFGALLSSVLFGEFKLRLPRRDDLWKAVLSGILIGIGVTLCPGTCTTSFVTGIPMLSVSSFLSAAGIFIGAYIVYSYIISKQ